jgi:serpin B
MRTRFLSLVVFLSLSGSLLGCGTDAPADPGEEAKSDKQRITSPSVSPSNLAQLTEDNTAFAFDLYQQLRGKPENLFYSPHSISIALAMTYGGAKGTTEQEMQKTLHYTLGQSGLHAAFNALDLELARRGQGAQGKDGGKFRLNVVNATWGQKGYPFLAPYLDLLAENYGAGMRLMNFVDQPEPSRLAINEWVERMTENRIKDLIPQGLIDSLTRLVLTNAIYFNAAWRDKFDQALTKDGEFTKLDGSKITVSMMTKQDDHFRYAKTGGCEAVEVPYDGQELSMVLMLPEGPLDAFEASLDGGAVAKILSSLGGDSVQLTLPKFKMEGKFSLKETLSKLGMKEAFTDAADFSGMDGRPANLFISDVVHKSFIAIDETGTEAAAATAVIMASNAAPAKTYTVKLDRPFLFLIRDIKTGAILFVGRVVEPKI